MPRRHWLMMWMVAFLLGCDTGAPFPYEPGPQLLADMISGRLQAEDVPDHGLAMNGDSLYVVQLGAEDSDWGALTSELFDLPSTTIVVTTLDALRELSEARGGEGVTYLGVGTPRQQSETRWLVSLGGDYVTSEPEEMRLCCCTGDALFEVGPDRFSFVEWSMTVCA